MKSQLLRNWQCENRIIKFMLAGIIIIFPLASNSQQDNYSQRYTQIIRSTLESYKQSKIHYKQKKIQRQLVKGEISSADTAQILSEIRAKKTYLIPVNKDSAFKARLEMQLDMMQSYDEWDLFSKLGRDTLDLLISKIPNRAAMQPMNLFDAEIKKAPLEGKSFYGHGFSSAIEIAPNRYIIFHSYSSGLLSGYGQMILYQFSDQGELSVVWRHLMYIS